MRRFFGVVAALVVVAACSPGSSTFAVTHASVDPMYYCPGGAANAPYDLHATVLVRNGTNAVVAIRSVAARMTLDAVTGSWLEKVGDRYDASGVKFTPATVAAGQSATLNLTIPSACTSGPYGTGVSSSGDYRVTIDLATSAGSFSITADNLHEIVAA